jgi:hypothetical protein
VIHGLVLGADYRHIAFRSLKVDAAIANLDYYFEKPMWILTSFAANQVAGATTPAFLVRFNSRVRKNLTVQRQVTGMAPKFFNSRCRRTSAPSDGTATLAESL